MFVVAGVRMRGRSGAAAVPASCAVVVTTVAALVVMFVHQDPRSVETPTMGSAVSDVVTPVESLAALLLVAVTIAVAVLAGLSRPGRSADAPGG